MKDTVFKSRIRIFFVLVALFTLFIIVRLYFLQIINGSKYSDRANRQYVSISTDTFDRGSIFFEDKDGSRVSAAGLKSGYMLAFNLKSATSTDDYFKKINAVLPIDESDFYSKISNKNASYVQIADKISEDDIKKISALNLPGAVITKENWRYYPGNSLAAGLVGFVGFDDAGRNLEGRYGLEKYYDDILTRSGGNLYVNVFAELFSDINKNFIDNKNREGNIITSIDPEVQGYVEKVIRETNTKWNSKMTGAIVIDPKNGELYAMALAPSFNLNNFSKEKDISIYANPLVSSAYEMGSIIKPLTVAAALDDGDITASTKYNDTGFLELDGRTIYNYDKKARGVIDIQQVLNQSLNVGAAFVADRLGKQNFLKYFEGYGIGSETGIDMPNEAAGNISNLLANLTNTKKIEYATASFGQGISMTPIITVRALSTLANGGKLIIPHVATKIEYVSGLSKNISYVDEAKQVLKPSTSEEITRMLVRVVDEALANGSMKMKNYSIAAKTGTAQIARPARDGGGYYPDEWLHSFFGYFPAYNPRFLVFLYTFEPQGVNYASQTLTSPFFDITKFLINYYEIPPDR